MLATPTAAFSNLSAWTIVTWILNRFAEGNAGSVFQKGRYGTATTTIALLITNTPALRVNIDRSTTDVDYLWNDATLFVTGWHFLSATFDRSAGAGVMATLAHGTPWSSPQVVAPSSTQDGSGTYGDDSSDYGRIGNDGAPLGANASALMWPMAMIAIYNRALSLDESVSVWKNPFAMQDGSCKGLYLPTNPSFCRDLSGNQNDTIVAQSQLGVAQFFPTLYPRQLSTHRRNRSYRTTSAVAGWGPLLGQRRDRLILGAY